MECFWGPFCAKWWIMESNLKNKQKEKEAETEIILLSFFRNGYMKMVCTTVEMQNQELETTWQNVEVEILCYHYLRRYIDKTTSLKSQIIYALVSMSSLQDASTWCSELIRSRVVVLNLLNVETLLYSSSCCGGP